MWITSNSKESGNHFRNFMIESGKVNDFIFIDFLKMHSKTI